jgi:Tol biopolymer transport system component/DNA-binding winged helix-turn-helix (wHTH) protein
LILPVAQNGRFSLSELPGKKCYTFFHSCALREGRNVQGPVRFGPFEVSSDSGELRKNGKALKISGQAIQVLIILLDSPGRVVAREELQEKLWPGATFGDFEHGLNAAVNRLREVLGDSASEPQYIETVPRRGYRFVAQTEQAVQHAPKSQVRATVPEKGLAAGLLRHRVLLLIAGGTLLLACAGTYVLLHHLRNSSQELNVVPFTTYPGYEASPSFSPDGNQIAFSWFQQEPSAVFKGDLYVKQIGNENAVRLTHHEAEFLNAAWSPDGLKIAFAMVGKDGNGIYLLPSLGGRERHLVDLRPHTWQWLLLSWSPDSKWLAFTSDSVPSGEGTALARYRIHLLNVQTGEERILPEPAPDCSMTIEPAISPDGKYLASVCVLTMGVDKLYVQQIDGKLPRELVQVDTSYVLAGIAWSADGQSIIYSTYGTTGRLWRVPALGGRPEPLFSAHGSQNPAVAYVGNRLAYMQTNYHFDIWRIGLDTRKNAAPPTKFISSTWDQANAQISPDGRLIAFDSSRSGNYEIWVCDRDGSKLQQLTFGGSQAGSPRWSPDGKQLVYNSRISGQMGLYVVPLDGGRPHQIATGTPNALWPFWSSDGRWIYFATEQPKGIWKVSAGGGAAMRLSSDGTYPQESGDGKRVFYVAGKGEDELWSVSVNGGDEHREEGIPHLVNDISWTPFQNGIYFIDGPPGHLAVKYFDFSDRKILPVADLRGITFLCCGIAVTRNNDALLFSGLDHLESDIILVENFH